MNFWALTLLFLLVFKFSLVGLFLNFFNVPLRNLTAFLHSSLNHNRLYFEEVELLDICSSAMFNSVLVKYRMSSSLFLSASGVSWARHEILNPSQLAFYRFQLGILILILLVLFSHRIGKWSLPLVSSSTFQL